MSFILLPGKKQCLVCNGELIRYMDDTRSPAFNYYCAASNEGHTYLLYLDKDDNDLKDEIIIGNFLFERHFDKSLTIISKIGKFDAYYVLTEKKFIMDIKTIMNFRTIL